MGQLGSREAYGSEALFDVASVGPGRVDRRFVASADGQTTKITVNLETGANAIPNEFLVPLATNASAQRTTGKSGTPIART